MNPAPQPPDPPAGERRRNAAPDRAHGREGKFNLVIGILFLLWTGADVAAGLYGAWYSHVPFALVGCAFVVYGIIQLRTAGKL